MLSIQMENGRVLVDASAIEKQDVPHAAETLRALCQPKEPRRIKSSGQMLHDDGFPNHPNDNPSVAEGIYDATVHGARWLPYAKGQCVRILLELEHGQRMVSNLYYRHDSKPDSVDRILRYLCDAVDESTQVVKDDPSILDGSRLRVDVKTANEGHSYIDRFLAR